ncbi:MAG: alpha/beta hydrolase domain-containing protein [Dehalococcoidia bacterium]
MDTQIRLQIHTREPFAGGMEFGGTGPYERIAGRVLFAINPEAAENQGVVDLENAPCNPSGLVEYATDFYILKPVDLLRGNGRLVYDVNNRGNMRILQFFNDATHSNGPSTAAHAGNGFLMRRGYTVLWSGWQGDILPGEERMTMTLPVAKSGGKEITGTMRAEFIASEPGILSWPLSANDYTLSYEATSLDTTQATLTRREYERDQREPVASGDWQFARIDEGDDAVPSPFDCYLPAGFRPGWIYELIYTAKDPLVLGLGFTGLRDLVSFLLHADSDDDGTPNPLKQQGGGIEKAYAWGRSQSGRFLREFVYRGFNQDSEGRRVFDAVWPHVAGCGRVALNYRFAQPGRFPRQHADHLYPSDEFPFAYAVTGDPHTGKTDGILKRPDTDPLVIHTQTSSEYWERRGSLVHTDTLGNDLDQHERARVYLFASSQHNAAPNGGPQYGANRHPTNPLNTSPLLRALLDTLDAWATNGMPPPDSCVPSRTSETAVTAEAVSRQFPNVPGVACPDEPNRLYVQDYGPDFDRGIFSMEPPQEDVSREYAVQVPLVDADGNDIPGVRTPHVEAPLATFTGWNLRCDGMAEKAMAGVVGSYVPFAATVEERKASGDPRPSLEERYRSRAHYVRAIASAVQALVDQRLLLEEDADRYVQTAMKEEAIG